MAAAPAGWITQINRFQLRDMIAAFYRRRYVVLGVTVVVVAIAAAALQFVTPRYTANALLMIDPNQAQRVAEIDPVSGGGLMDSVFIDSQAELLRSQSLAIRTVRKFNLDNDPEFVGAGGGLGGLVASVRTMIFGASESAAPMTPDRRVLIAAQSLTSRLSVARRGLTMVISVSFESRDAVKAAMIANGVADLYLTEQLEAKFENTKRLAEWLDARIGELQGNMETAERAVETYKSQNNLSSTRGVTVTEQQLSDLNTQITLAKADTAEKLARWNQVRNAQRSGRTSATLPEVLSNTAISSLKTQLAEVSRREADMAARYGSQHPLYVNVTAERRDIEGKIASETERVVQGVRNAYETAAAREASLVNSLAGIQQRTDTSNEATIRLRELERQAASTRTVYEAFLNRFKQTREKETLDQSNARVISQATVPGAPSFPNKPAIFVASLVVGLLSGAGLALFLDKLNSGLQTPEQVAEAVGQTVIATMPFQGEEERSQNGQVLLLHEMVIAKPLSLFAESVRSLRTAIEMSDVDHPPKVIMVTSSVPAEGKSSVSVSLAMSAQKAGKSTIILDLDLRRPVVGTRFGVKPEHGIVDYLLGNVDLRSVIQIDPYSGVHFIPCLSNSISNAPDLLGSERLANTVKQLAKHYDLVVFDTAPVMAASDARRLTPLVDKIVYVVEWNKTPRESVTAAVAELGEGTNKIAGIVFSKADMNRFGEYNYQARGYYYRKYSYYRSGYGSDNSGGSDSKLVRFAKKNSSDRDAA
jgi:succinoglycan biosynthesis transport protein ExoP